MMKSAMSVSIGIYEGMCVGVCKCMEYELAGKYLYVHIN